MSLHGKVFFSFLLLFSGYASSQLPKYQSLGFGWRESYYPKTLLSGILIQADLPISKYVSAQYSVSGGFASGKGFYVQLPITLPFGLAAFATYPNFWALVAVIPESISFKVSNRSYSELRLNINFNSFLYTEKDSIGNFDIPLGIGSTVFLKNRKRLPYLRFDLTAGVLPSQVLPYVQFSAGWCISRIK